MQYLRNVLHVVFTLLWIVWSHADDFLKKYYFTIEVVKCNKRNAEHQKKLILALKSSSLKQCQMPSKINYRVI